MNDSIHCLQLFSRIVFILLSFAPLASAAHRDIVQVHMSPQSALALSRMIQSNARQFSNQLKIIPPGTSLQAIASARCTAYGQLDPRRGPRIHSANHIICQLVSDRGERSSLALSLKHVPLISNGSALEKKLVIDGPFATKLYSMLFKAQDGKETALGLGFDFSCGTGRKLCTDRLSLNRNGEPDAPPALTCSRNRTPSRKGKSVSAVSCTIQETLTLGLLTESCDDVALPASFKLLGTSDAQSKFDAAVFTPSFFGIV